MNSAQLLDPGEGIPGVVKPNMPPEQNKEGAQLIMSHVAQILANQGPFGGWKADVHIKTRAMNVYQMYVVLLLMKHEGRGILAALYAYFVFLCSTSLTVPDFPLSFQYYLSPSDSASH